MNKKFNLKKINKESHSTVRILDRCPCSCGSDIKSVAGVRLGFFFRY
jgi:hypothetical protein